ncbi:MAG TPA: ADP-ribosylglycohydrolase family protein [Gemmatimonadota bacterium]|nr:ADP-ribosylglycohydrolase family protein [Gemmatimonadota bacterium]
MLEAVNLGDDADTTGAVAGGLAGVMLGEGTIPQEWVQALEKPNVVWHMAHRFAKATGARRSDDD